MYLDQYSYLITCIVRLKKCILYEESDVMKYKYTTYDRNMNIDLWLRSHSSDEKTRQETIKNALAISFASVLFVYPIY